MPRIVDGCWVAVVIEVVVCSVLLLSVDGCNRLLVGIADSGVLFLNGVAWC